MPPMANELRDSTGILATPIHMAVAHVHCAPTETTERRPNSNPFEYNVTERKHIPTYECQLLTAIAHKFFVTS